MDNEGRFYTEKEVARFLGFSVKTLGVWRRTKKQFSELKWKRFGKTIRYYKEPVDRILKSD